MSFKEGSDGKLFVGKNAHLQAGEKKKNTVPESVEEKSSKRAREEEATQQECPTPISPTSERSNCEEKLPSTLEGDHEDPGDAVNNEKLKKN